MKVLHLTLKKQWFDMIASGEKKEEYREIKPYWQSRLCSHFPHKNAARDYDYILFKNGYSDKSPWIKVEWKDMVVATGKPDWGAEPGKEYFVIKLGEIIPPLAK